MFRCSHNVHHQSRVERSNQSTQRPNLFGLAAFLILFSVAQAGATENSGDLDTTLASAPDENWSNLAYGNGVWVAVSGSGDVMTSPDGIDWTQTRDADDGSWSDVEYGNGLFVALNTRPDSTGLQSMTSTDGVTWTTHAGSSRGPWVDLAYGNGVWVAVGWRNNDSDKVVMTSPDGITWTPRSSASDKRIWMDVTYGDGRFVAVSQGTSTLYAWTMTSTDGINWTGGAAPSPTQQTWSSVTYGDGLFVAVSATGDGGRVMTSSDGVTWTRQSTPGASRWWNSVTYGDGLFVAVLGSVYGNKYWKPVMTSPDGITWTLRDGAKNQDWTEVLYANGRFVAITGYNGIYVGTDRVMSSTDGLTWSLEYAQSITFVEPASQSLGDGSLALSASASSSLSVSYASSTTSVCTVSGSTVSFVAAGTCTITASQPGDATYAAAADVSRSFAIGKAPQSITFNQPADDVLASGGTSLTGSASSGLPVSYASSTTDVCTVSGANVTYVAFGICSITASQAGNNSYEPAADVTKTFSICTAADDCDGDGASSDNDTNELNPDADGDGTNDGADNCPVVSNTDQTDTDSDGIGDLCDDNDDNDGVLDVDEVREDCRIKVDCDDDGETDLTDPFPLAVTEVSLDTGASIKIVPPDRLSTCSLLRSAAYLSPYTAPEGMESIGTQAHFSLSGCDTDSPETISVEVNFGKALPAEGLVCKVEGTSEPVDMSGASISGTSVSYTLTDNGQFDTNAVAGVIDDPVTVIVPNDTEAPTAAPTASPAVPVSIHPFWLLLAGLLIPALVWRNFQARRVGGIA